MIQATYEINPDFQIEGLIKSVDKSIQLQKEYDDELDDKNPLLILEFSEDSAALQNKAFTEYLLAEIIKYKNERGIDLSLHVIMNETLSLDVIETLIANPSILDAYALEKIFCLSDEIAERCLKSPLFQERINTFRNNPHKQTFTNSCAARALLRIMLDLGIIEDKAYNGAAHELMIYKQIWQAPGKPAHPHKLVSFIQEHNMDVMGITAEDQITPALSMIPSLHIAFSIFKKSVPKLKQYQTIKSDDFPTNQPILMVVGYGSIEGHILYCKKLADDSYQVFNPGTGDTTHYASLTEFFGGEKSLGVYFSINKAKELNHSVSMPNQRQ